jgi:glycosyltransferase involved in cell wall biosynthesis
MFGGVETLLVTLGRQRALCLDMATEFVLCFEGRLSRELTQSGARLHMMGPVRFSHPWTVYRARRRFRALLHRVHFHVGVFHSEWPLAIFGPVARQTGIPVVFWNHNFINDLTWLHRLAGWVVPDLIISTSKAAANTTDRLFPNVPTECLYCPISLPQLAFDKLERTEVRNEFDTPEDAVVIVQTSRMDAYKGHRLHIEALGHLRDVPGWVCWQVGGSQRAGQTAYLRQLQEQAIRVGIADRVRFVGERSDVWRLLQAADIHCQPNAGPEPFGIAFVEALHARLPAVTTAIGGALEIVDDGCGILVPPNDSHELARQLCRLIEDTQLRRELGHNGPARAKELCDPARQISHLRELLKSVATGSAPQYSQSISA